MLNLGEEGGKIFLLRHVSRSKREEEKRIKGKDAEKKNSFVFVWKRNLKGIRNVQKVNKL